VLNTEAVINLQDVEISTAGDVLIRATDSSDDDEHVNSDWGTAGGDITFTATDQVLNGTVSCNEISSIDLTLTGSSTLTGAVEVEDGGAVQITLADSAVWTATGDSYVTSLDGISFSGDAPTNVDAGAGVVIYYENSTDADGNALSGTYTLPSGGTLVKN
jgi:hypothetical protein